MGYGQNRQRLVEMNILIVASKLPPEYSGPGVRIPRLYKSIRNDIGLKKLSALCGSTEFSESKIYDLEGIAVTRVVPSCMRRAKFLFKFLPKSIYEIFTYLEDNIIGLLALRQYKDIDMVHILGTSGITAAALFWAKHKKIPVFQELVTAKASPCQRLFLFGSTAPLQKSVIVTMRNDVRDRAKKLGYKNQIWHRPNPFNQDIFHPVSESEKSSLRKALTPFKDGDIILCSIAKIIPQKNQIFLMDVLSLLEPRYKLLIAGPKVEQGPLFERDNEYLNAVKKKIQDYGLHDRVHLYTNYVESHQYMKACDHYMLPAYDEGFGTPMMEAIACGLPVIANKDEFSFAEWLNDGENGYLSALTPHDWAQACLKAEAMPLEKRLDEAKNIVNLAGQALIYKGYIEKIHSLTRT